MVPRSLRAGLVLWVVSVMLLAAGCTKSDALNSGVGAQVLQVELINPQVPYDSARFDVSQIFIEPLDEQASAVLGAAEFGLINQQSFDEDSNAQIRVFYDGPSLQQRNVTVMAGQYLLLRIDLTNVSFTKTGCSLTNSDPIQLIFKTFTGTEILPETMISLRPDVGSNFKIRIDGQQFLQVLQDALGGAECGVIDLFASFTVTFNADKFISFETSP